MRIGTGLWFASMNYTVHAIMYFYYGLTQCGPKGARLVLAPRPPALQSRTADAAVKKFAKRLNMFITSLQLLQMVVRAARPSPPPLPRSPPPRPVPSPQISPN